MMRNKFPETTRDSFFQQYLKSSKSDRSLGALIRTIKFLSPEVGVYLYKSTIWPCMEYCCHVWAGAPSYYLDLLDKPQKQICRTVGP